MTLQLHTHTLTLIHVRSTLTHSSYSPQVLGGVLCQLVPKTASMLIKIAQWPALWWKSELLLSHICLGGSHKDGPWCVGLEMLFCPPSVVPFTTMSPTGDTVNRQRYKDYVFKDARVSHDIVCDIWSTAELQANNIFISFFGLNVFSGGCSWWRHLLRLLNYSSKMREWENTV